MVYPIVPGSLQFISPRLLYRLPCLYHIWSCNNLVGMLYIIFNVFLYTVVVFLVNGKIQWMNEWMNKWMNCVELFRCFVPFAFHMLVVLHSLWVLQVLTPRTSQIFSLAEKSTVNLQLSPPPLPPGLINLKPIWGGLI